MICQYCGHKLTDGKCLNPACPGRLRRESVSELKPDIHNIEAITLKKFADRHGLIMEVHERRRPISDPARYYACFKNSEIEEKGFLMSAFGDGSTPDEAISNYIKRIEFKLLVIDAYTSNRRKIEVPRIIIPHPAPVEVERLVDDLLSVSKQLGQSEARGLYDHIEPAEVAINDLKSRLLAALPQPVPVEELEQDLEQYITLGSTGCRTIAEDVEFNRLHSKFLAALSNTTPYLSQDVSVGGCSGIILKQK